MEIEVVNDLDGNWSIRGFESREEALEAAQHLVGQHAPRPQVIIERKAKVVAEVGMSQGDGE